MTNLGGTQFSLRPVPRAARTETFSMGLTQTQLLLHAFKQVTQYPIAESQHCHPYTALWLLVNEATNQPVLGHAVWLTFILPGSSWIAPKCARLPAQTCPVRGHSTQLQFRAKPPLPVPPMAPWTTNASGEQTLKEKWILSKATLLRKGWVKIKHNFKKYCCTP